MTDVPAPLKALVGLVAAALDRLPEPRELPEKAVELPVLAVSAVLQASLRAQQLYAELTTRGDEAISQLRGAPEEAPPWASFDDAPDNADSGAHGADLSDEAEVDPLDAALLDATPSAGQHAAAAGVAGPHGPSAFDLADDADADDINDDGSDLGFADDSGSDRPLGD